jgi:hypothetical protein
MTTDQSGRELFVSCDGAYYGNSNLTVYSTVPEPSTLVLLGIGAMGLSVYAWRQRVKL